MLYQVPKSKILRNVKCEGVYKFQDFSLPFFSRTITGVFKMHIFSSVCTFHVLSHFSYHGVLKQSLVQCSFKLEVLGLLKVVQ